MKEKLHAHQQLGASREIHKALLRGPNILSGNPQFNLHARNTLPRSRDRFQHRNPVINSSQPLRTVLRTVHSWQARLARAAHVHIRSKTIIFSWRHFSTCARTSCPRRHRRASSAAGRCPRRWFPPRRRKRPAPSAEHGRSRPQSGHEMEQAVGV